MTRGPDPSDMWGRVRAFPEQLREAWKLARNGPRLLSGPPPSRVYVCAMGGSAIGGDFLAAVAAERGDVPVQVVRGYDLPRAARADAFAFFVSYSGDTEETLSGWECARRRGLPRAAITTGGTLAELAEEDGAPCLRLPGGSPPRAALGWTSVPMFAALSAAGRMDLAEGDIEEAAAACGEAIERHGSDASASDPLRSWAEACADRLAVIYAPASPYAPCARRWSGQLNENAKSLAHAALLPEQNHNEIVGWEVRSPVHELCVVAFLGAGSCLPRVRRRMSLVREAVERAGARTASFEPFGRSLPARVFSLATLGDLASLHLASARGVDPTPVASIDRLKAELARAEGDPSPECGVAPPGRSALP